MTKVLEYLQINEGAMHVAHFIQHITELLQVKLTKDTTLSDVVTELKKQVGSIEDAKQGIDSWADMQDQELLPMTIYEAFGIDAEEEEDNTLFIVFNLWNNSKE